MTADPPRRRRGVVIVPESDIARLVRLEPGQRIAGMRDDPMRMAFAVLVEGDGLPEVPEACEPRVVSGMRWAAPPPPMIDLADADMPAGQIHALVLTYLRTVDDLDPPPGTAWAALDTIVRRHAPFEMSGAWWCTTCCGSCQHGEHAPWPCADYVAAASPIVAGLQVSDG